VIEALLRCTRFAKLTLDVMYANAPYTVIQRVMHIHPAQQICFPQLSTTCRAVASREGGSTLNFCEPCSVNGADGISDIEGKAVTGGGEQAGRGASFKFAISEF